jgi:hypothetical protein
MILGSDLGSYLSWDKSSVMPWKDLIEKGKIQFFITKGAEDYPNNYYSTTLNVKFAKDAGIPVVATYYWFYPLANQKYYIDLYSKEIDTLNPDFIAVDMEEVDRDSAGKLISPQLVSDNAHILMDGLKSKYPQKQVIIYTRPDYVASIFPQMQTWIKEYDGGWIAAWPDYGLASYVVDWAYLSNMQTRQNLNVGSTSSAYKEINISNGSPSLIPTWTTWKFWQYSSRMKINPSLLTSPIYDHQYDWNVFNGSLEDLKAWIKKSPIVPPVTPPILPDRLTNLENWAVLNGYIKTKTY